MDFTFLLLSFTQYLRCTIYPLAHPPFHTVSETQIELRLSRLPPFFTQYLRHAVDLTADSFTKYLKHAFNPPLHASTQ